MKRIIFNIFLAATILSITSCSDLLNENVYTQVTTDFITSTPAGMASAVLAMYEKDREIFRTNSDTESTMWTNLLIGDDISYPRAGAGIPQFGRYTLLPSTPNVGVLWQQEYALIGYANLVIATAAKVDMTDPIAIQALAEAKVFRAHAYFWLIRKYDRIFLTTRVTTPENVNDPITYAPAVPDSVFKLINSDLDYAIAHLDWPTVPAKQPGRFNQGVARHIKAKVAAWQQNWQEVANQVSAINAKPAIYSLLTNAGDVFSGADLNNTESILVSQWSKGMGGWFVSPNTGLSSGHRMPLHFVPLYNQEQGMMIDFASGAYPWGRIFPNVYLFSLYDKVKDTRYKNWYKLAWTFNNAAGLPRGKKLGDTLVVTNAAQYLNLHPMCTKYNDSWTRATPNETQSFKDIIIYRLAETYLMGAEAYLHLGKTDSCAYYYNKTWVRAGNTAIASGAVTMDMITDEHARELAFEGDRWFYLKRNGLLISKVKKYGGEYYKKGTVVMIADTAVRVNIQPFHVRWPIPQSQVDQMGAANFPQNLGY